MDAEALEEIRWIIENSDGLLGLSHPDPMTWEKALQLYCPTLRVLLNDGLEASNGN